MLPSSGRMLHHYFPLVNYTDVSWHTDLFYTGNNTIIIIIIQKIYSAHISTMLGAQGVNPETPGQVFHDEFPGLFYVRYTTHRTHSFTSHPKDEAIMVKCLAQGHKRRDRGQAGIRTHVLTTPELEYNALDCSATTLTG